MSDSLIEQLKRLAEFQERVGIGAGWEKHQFSMLLGGTIYRGTIDFPALLAHLERTQAVVDAARKAKHYLEHRTTCKYLWDGVECDCGYIAASAALDAALKAVTAARK